MRRTCLSPLLALGLLAAPLAAVPSAAAGSAHPQPHPHSATATAAGSGALSPVAGTGRTRLAQDSATHPHTTALRATAVRTTTRKRTLRPGTRPAVRPAPKATTVAPPTRPGAYAFLHVDAGRPVRWNPCDAVPWVFNPKGAPAGGLTAVQAAVREVAARTGLRFAYQGTTTTPVDGAYLQQTWKQFKPLLVGWTAAGESDLLAGRGATTVGMARVLWTGSYDSTGANRTQLASGVVALNRATSARTTGAGSWYTYALHELGHAVGLDHVADTTQVMNASISSRLSGFGKGDLTGLVAVGARSGCLPDIR